MSWIREVNSHLVLSDPFYSTEFPPYQTFPESVLIFPSANRQWGIEDIVDDTISLIRTIITHDEIKLELDTLDERYPEFAENKITIVKGKDNGTYSGC